jgi:hypothetical protein
MGKISTYAVDSTPSLSDKVIGTEVGNLDATKNYTIGSIVSLANANLYATQVLNGVSFNIQAPSALNTPLIVEFGAAQGSPSTPVQLDAFGKVTFNESGLYFVNGFGSVERQGSSGGVSILLFRTRLNGIQISSTKGFHLDTPNLPTEYEVTIPFQATAGDVLWFEIMRDSSGTNQGGVYPHTVLGGWSNVPSSQIQIWKFN